MNYIKHHIFVFWVLLVAALAFGAPVQYADAGTLPQSIDFEHFSTKDGLANPVVYDMIQDRHGFLWFGTGNGISKFNGYEFINYFPDAADAYSIGKGPVLKLFLDSKNNIWATSLATGLYQYDEQNNRFIYFRHDPDDTNSLPSDTAYNMDEDKSGNLWISTLDAGIVRYDPKSDTYTRYQHEPGNPNSLSSNRTTAIFCDSRGDVWISTMKKGLDRLDPETGKVTHYLPDTPHAVDIIEDRFHDIWIPTLGQGVYRFIRNENRFVSYMHDDKDPGSISHNQVVKAFEDSNGTVWLTTWGGGVNIYDRKKDRFVSYKHDAANPFSLNHNSTWGIYEDHSGVIWIGTYGAGVNKFDRKKERFRVMRHYPGRQDGLSHSSVKTIYEDTNGDFWFGTLGGGMTHYNPETGQYRHFTNDAADTDTICHNNVWKIVEDKQQNLWIGTENGLDKYDRRFDKFYHFKKDDNNPHSIGSNVIRNIMIDDRNRLWVGTQLHGVDRLDLSTVSDASTVQFEHFKVPGGHNSVLFQDSSKDIWAANQRLFRFDKTQNRFNQWRFSPSDEKIVPQGLFTAMAEDLDHHLWIGTTSRLFRLNPKTNELKQYGPEQGLNDSSIAGLQFYPPNHLWISTSKGLSVMDLSNGEIKNYELGTFNRGAALMGRSGELFFGAINGVVYFSPRSIFDNPHIPNIVITSFKKINTEYDAPSPLALIKHLNLSYEDRFFSFEFAALDYSDPEKNRYRFRLLGFDDNWIQVDSRRRFASYTNLDPGSYLFQVHGSNNDGVWNDTGVSVEITITPPWWESNWFYSAVALLIIFIVLVTVWYLMRLRFEINERRRAETSLRVSEEKYRRLTENAKDMIYRMSLPEGKYEYVSPAAETIFGYAPETWYDNPIMIQDIIHPDFHGYFKEKWDQLLKGGVESSYEYKILFRGTETRWIHQRNVDVRDENGKLIAIEGIVTDITGIKQSEKALQESHRRFLTVLNSIDATIYVADIETHQILFMNQYMIESFGRDMTGEICWDVFRGEAGQCAHCPIDKLVDENGDPKGVHIWQTKNPITKKWYMNYDRAIEWTDGRIVKLQIASDITKLKQMEEELRHVHKMESIGTIAGGIAHDFNNILGIIIGNIELAIDDIPEWSSALDNLQEIRIAGMRAKDIVKQLLSFSRKTEQAQKNIRILPIIKESIKLIRSSIPTTIDIQLDAEDIEGVIKADPTQIHQILINMCTNAAHAMDESGGTLSIGLSETELDAVSRFQFQDVEPGRYVQLTIADTGVGIDSAIADKIFDPYFTTKEIGKGSGMGLAVVHGIVKNYNGAISIYSEPLKGTTFKILFPAAKKGPGKEETSMDIIPTGNEKILFIDDEEALAKMGATMLERLGYDVVWQTEPLKALDLVKAEPSRFDLVITDMTMPLLTGDQLTLKILEVNPDMPVILATGFSHKIDRETALEMGIRHYIDKPLNKARLATVVRNVLAGPAKP